MLRVHILPEAEVQVRSLTAWWRINRPDAGELVKEELTRALELLAGAPNLGSVYQKGRRSGVRRYLLKRTPYHVYYWVDEAKQELVVMSVWSTMRRRGPKLAKRSR